ncbi:alpha/beta fold hydrolase [Allomuricauda sp. SCSIO 65647]|uniref:alpha/beta fold hydrolase n=1 Tax=Allomuricauda sp. SCSIO 65647 TaxID=2908843 RepID=UPI001F2844D2|nr:alpha/beta hydrolase [Muricauda sp. SCSIO 65647]UJH66734.1 alpha/beta hydrolase [Muricauda sp. SCSIO 65647]
MKSKVTSTKLGDIEYRSIGSGIPVVFVHGGHSNCHETLCHKGFDLKKFRLITPSRPGYGKTPLRGNQTPRKSAALIAELLDFLSVEQTIVYGISAGGPTAIELAAQYPNKVHKLILASAVSKKWLDQNERIYKTARFIFNPKIEKLTWGMIRFFSRIFPKAMAKSFFVQFSIHPMGKLKRDDIQELVSALKHYNSGQGFLNDIDQDLTDNVLAKVKCPTLVIHSENDNSVHLSHARHAHKMIENSKLEILQNEWGHLFWIGADAMESITKTIKYIDR